MHDVEDNLGKDLERLTAQAVAHSSQIMEAFMRRIRDSRSRAPVIAEAGQAAFTGPGETGYESGEERPGDVEQARDAQLTAVTGGLDPRRLGDRQHVAEWVSEADPNMIAAALAEAERFAAESADAALLRDELEDRVREYGLDPEQLRGLSAETIAAELRAADDFGQASGDAEQDVDRDAAEVHGLLGEADAADRESGEARSRAEQSQGEADQVPRSERVTQVSTGPAGKAATSAARDHPTNPARATEAAAKQPAKARRTGRAGQRERAHSGR